MEQNIILGPPGTGKTTELLRILDKFLIKYKPDEIAYVSFTREGAYQGRDRAIQQFNYTAKEFPYFKTLHSIAFAEGGFSRNQVIQKRHYKQFGDAIGMNFSGYYTQEMFNNDDRYLFYLDVHKNNHRVAAQYLNDLNITILRYIHDQFKRFKTQMNLVNFTDMIELYINKNKPLPVKVAIIDEAQDLTSLQWKMILVAFRNCDEIYIAGDDDQAIYEWSGADVNYFLNLKGKLKILNKSYRLPNKILKFSQKIAHTIEQRVDKNIFGKNEHGAVYYLQTLKDLSIKKNYFEDETWLFLTRNNYYIKEIESFLTMKGLPYICKGKASVVKDEVTAINLYEKHRKTPGCLSTKEMTLVRSYVASYCTFTRPWFEAFNEVPLIRRNYYRDLLANKVDITKLNIRIDTIHAVKGAEADNVVVLTDITKSVQNSMDKNMDSELRVFYVGCTRAKKRLFIVYPQGKYFYDFLKYGIKKS